MESQASSPTGLINLGTAAYHNGQRADARDFFWRALLDDPRNEFAWIWYATVAEDRGEQRYCINRALAINPESTARARLRSLQLVAPKVPAELAELDDADIV